MAEAKLSDAKIFKYQFDLSIDRDVTAVWTLMTDEINQWWISDFRALGENSTVTLEAKTGGSLVEASASGESLEWYRVQMCQPGKALYLVGSLAPDWGGPTTSMLKLALEEQGDACRLIVSDALLGNVTEKSAGSAEEGWTLLFRDGLKAHAEK